MKRIIFIVGAFFFALEAISQSREEAGLIYKAGQKLHIDTSTYDRWSSVGQAAIDDNGRFISYVVEGEPMGSFTTVLKECNGNWEMRIPGVKGVQFTADGRVALYLTPNDTLCLVNLGEGRFRSISHVSTFSIPIKGKGEWLAYKDNITSSIVLLNFRTRKSKAYLSSGSFYFDENGRFLIFEKNEKVNDSVFQSLNWLNLHNEEVRTIWSGRGLSRSLLDVSGSNVFFIVSGRDVKETTIWSYKFGDDSSRVIGNAASFGVTPGLKLMDISRISSDGKYLFVSLIKEKEPVAERARHPLVNIWSYQDEKLQPQQMKERDAPIYYSARINLVNRNFDRLEYDSEIVLGFSEDNNTFLIEKLSGNGDWGEVNWSKAAQRIYQLRILNDKRDVTLETNGNRFVSLSPEGKFVIFYDKETASFFSYEIASRIYRNITPDIDANWINLYREDLGGGGGPRGIAGWIEDDESVLIYDRFDIWLIDPLGRRKAENFTNGYGKRNNIIFYLGLSEYLRSPIARNSSLILNALNLSNKDNGFFRKTINKIGDPEILTMGPYIYQLIRNPYVSDAGAYPIKATNKNNYILLRRSATESPNYFFTTNFSDFTPLSNVYPEKFYQWYHTELITWKKDDGIDAQGVLYKPDDFDANRKYPIIFHYYEKKSFGLHEYLKPQNISGGCNIDIPSYVTNGYLVFCPDIDYIIGDPMQGTFNSVVSAAKYFSKLPFIDEKRMGIGGCSFGGIQTNYLVTHTNLFAAAYSSSSLSDFISAYGDVPGGERSLQGFFETGQARMGGTLWQKTELYIKNSSIFSADKVNTPLLMMHTTNDGVCSFSQAVEFFTALRRLGKRVWLLEYTEGDHAIGGESAIDFRVRLAQFFDHYLKGKPAPNWMMQGVSAKMKGIDNGLRLDQLINTPGVGLLKESQKK